MILRFLLPQKFPEIPPALDKKLQQITQQKKINNIISHFMELKSFEELEEYLK